VVVRADTSETQSPVQSTSGLFLRRLFVSVTDFISFSSVSTQYFDLVLFLSSNNPVSVLI
jgi:hypothetical protein